MNLFSMIKKYFFKCDFVLFCANSLYQVERIIHHSLWPSATRMSSWRTHCWQCLASTSINKVKPASHPHADVLYFSTILIHFVVDFWMFKKRKCQHALLKKLKLVLFWLNQSRLRIPYSSDDGNICPRWSYGKNFVGGFWGRC